jgi:hypothetical protein
LKGNADLPTATVLAAAFGRPSRPFEHQCQFVRIEQELGPQAKYLGKAALRAFR